MKNFTNGALVFRVWHFDGSGEIISKHQYTGHAEVFAKMMAEEDARVRPGDASKWVYIVVCEHDNTLKAFNPMKADVAA